MQKTLILILVVIFCIITSLSVSSCKKKSDYQPYQEDNEQTNETDDITKPAKDTTKTNEGVVNKYTYQYMDSKDIPPIAIVIDDFGQTGGALLQGFAELDDNVTFAILPDLSNTQKTAKLANVYGHEVILHIPMQALDKKQNPGKNYIHVGQDKAEIRDMINNFLDQVPQAIGANNHMGSGVTSDYSTIHSVMEVLDKKGLFFLDSKTAASSKVVGAAADLKINYAARDIFLDVPDVSNANISAKLKELQKYKGRVEPIIIISHCHNQAKLDAMRSFISQLKGMGIKLIPLSDAIKKFELPA